MFYFRANFLRTQTLSHTSSKMGLYTEVLLFVLLNGDSNRAMRFQCMMIRFNIIEQTSNQWS